ncbi:MAG: NAD(P)-dependent oxidoreductase [Candidatus Omnitrophota bacterium]
MKILITGGNGFIARNLSEGLAAEYEVVSRNSKELDLLEQEQVFDYIKPGRFDVVIHAATYDAAPRHSSKDPARVLENNLRMFFNLARCGDYFGRMFYFGSGAEFDRLHWVPKMKEEYFGRYLPSDQYGFSKYIMTKYAQSSGNIYNLRLFGVFGKYDDWRTRFIPNACAQAALGKPVVISQNRAFDFIYVNDLVRIVKWFIDNQPRKNIYNVCSGQVVDLKSLAGLIVKIAGKHLEIKIEQDGFGGEYSGDNALLLKELGGFEFSPLGGSLQELYDWYVQNQQIFVNAA